MTAIPDFTKIDFANEILGGGSSGRLFQTLRIQKGFTYGAYSTASARLMPAPFRIQTSVRANATQASLEIIRDMVRDYGPGFTQEDVELTRNKILKQNTRAYESLGAKLSILTNIEKFGRALDYIDQDQQLLMNMDLETFKAIIGQYMDESKMTYLVVGDKATQFEPVSQLGLPVVELDIYGNKKD